MGTERIGRLSRGSGELAYTVTGEGPLVVCAPGMGDLRSTYRHLVPPLVAAGYRVATLDLRGHGDSDTTFDRFDDEALADDLSALIDALGGDPAVVVGNSMAAGAAVILAARRPEQVRGLVLLGPFVRNPPVNPLMLALFRLLTAPWWAAAVWGAYLPTLYAGARPEDFEAHRAEVVAALRRPGHARAFSRTTRTTHAPAEAALAGVSAPSLAVMGALDPDFADPAAEAAWIAERLGSEVVMVPDCGHYPQAQAPGITADAVLRFLEGLDRA
ncbi:MAG: alpha/beta hydrolase [Myxococcota bacterium]